MWSSALGGAGLLLDGLDHGESHVDAVAGVLGAADGQSGDAVVAVAQRGDLLAVRLTAHPVKPGTHPVSLFSGNTYSSS